MYDGLELLFVELQHTQGLAKELRNELSSAKTHGKRLECEAEGLVHEKFVANKLSEGLLNANPMLTELLNRYGPQGLLERLQLLARHERLDQDVADKEVELTRVKLQISDLEP